MQFKTFQKRVCEYFACPDTKYTEVVFQHCLFPHARPLVPLLQRVREDYFQPDLELIERVKDATCTVEVLREVKAHKRFPRRRMGLGQRKLRIRVSGSRLLNLARHLLTSS